MGFQFRNPVRSSSEYAGIFHGIRLIQNSLIALSGSLSCHNMPDEEETEYHALQPRQTTTTNITALAFIALISGVANGYNGTLLEGATPRLRAVSIITAVWQSG